jgi:nucleotide-binding universal stress UspA family protein
VPCVEEKTRLSIRNILLATMFSEPSEAILGYVVSFARRYDAKMFWTGAASPEAIREIITKQEVDLMVIGTHAQESRKAYLDIAVEELLSSVPCSVVIIGPQVPQMELAKSEIETIVYVTDYTISSLDGVPYALAFAQDHDALLNFVHAAGETTLGPFHFGNSRIVGFQKRLESLIASGKGYLRESEFAVQEGNRAEGLVRIAANLRAGMIVMSARGNAVELMWPMAAQVVCRARCPVLVTRPFGRARYSRPGGGYGRSRG